MKNDALRNLDFDCNVQLILVIAATYGAACGTAPVRHLGQELAGRAITLGTDRYSITHTRQKVEGKETVGVLIVCDYNHNSAGERSKKTWFIPVDELAKCRFSVKGLEL